MINERDQRSFLDFARAPAGMSLTYCIGTTFTLDYPVLIQLALATQGYLGEEKDLTSEEAFARISSFDDRSIVFCQSCRIQKIPAEFFKPKKTNRQKLLSLLDSVIISMKSESNARTFHPKVWFLKFDHTDKNAASVWKLMVTSRNLSEASTWEIGAELIGRKVRKNNNANSNLVDFLNYLKHRGSKNKKARTLIDSAIGDLQHIEFDAPDQISEFEFLPKAPNIQAFDFLDSKKYSKIIAISPFLTKVALNRLNKFRDKVLVTSAKDVRLLSSFKDILEQAFLFRLDGLDLHSKMYLCQTKSGGSDVYLGSANLTTAGALSLGENVEAMVCLKSTRNLVSEFEKSFIYQKPKEKHPHPWLIPIRKEDFERSDKLLEQEKRLQELEDLRTQISSGSFVIRKASSRTWELKWYGNAINLPSRVRGTILVGDSGEPESLEEVLTDKAKIKLTGKSPMAFLWITLAQQDVGEIQFGTVAEVIGRTTSRSDDVWSQIVSESDAVSLLKALIGDYTNQRAWLGSEPGADTLTKRSRRAPNNRSIIEGLIETILISENITPRRRELISKTISELEKRKYPEIQIFRNFWKEYQKAEKELYKNAG